MDPITGRFFSDKGGDATTVIRVVELEDEPLVQSKTDKNYQMSTNPQSNLKKIFYILAFAQSWNNLFNLQIILTNRLDPTCPPFPALHLPWCIDTLVLGHPLPPTRL